MKRKRLLASCAVVFANTSFHPALVSRRKKDHNPKNENSFFFLLFPSRPLTEQRGRGGLPQW